MDSSYIIASRTRKIKGTVYDRFGEPRICVQNVPLHDDKDGENEDEAIKTIKTDDRRNIDPDEDEYEDKKEQEDKDEDTVQKVPINSNSNCEMVRKFLY